MRTSWTRVVLLTLVGFALACGGQSSGDDADSSLPPKLEELRGWMPRVGVDPSEWLEYSEKSEVPLLGQNASVQAAEKAYALLVARVVEQLGEPYTTLLAVSENEVGGASAFLERERGGVFCPVEENVVAIRHGDADTATVEVRVEVWIRKAAFIPPEYLTDEAGL